MNTPLNMFIFLFISLLLIQNGLSYTTYGQSKYWNFTHEMVYVVFILVLGLNVNMIAVTILGLVLAILLVVRQWINQEYSKLSKVIGSIVLALASLSTVINPLNIDYTQKSASSLVPYVGLSFVLIFIIVYIVQNPRFVKKLMKK
jgi:hypothetical protein